MCSSLQAELRNSAHQRSRGSSSDEERETEQRTSRRTAPVSGAGGVHTRQRTSPRCWWCSHDGLHQSPVLVVSTSAVNESTACQKMLSVNDNGLFQTDVAVSDEFSTWSIAVTSCASQSGKHSADQCRTVHVEPPGEPVGDGCLPAANRVVPTGHDHPDKSHYAVRVDFRRCFEHRQSGGDKPRVVKFEELAGKRYGDSCLSLLPLLLHHSPHS